MNEIVKGRGWGSGAGRQKGTPNKKTVEAKEQTKEFFARIVDDEIEAKFWRYFMTGYETHELPDGRMQIIPIPLDPIAFAAFKRAVEYKRGLPVQVIAHEDRQPMMPMGEIFDSATEDSGRIC